MKKKKQNKIFIALIVVAVLLLGWFVFVRLYYGTATQTSLSIAEKRWLESSKATVFDISMINSVPVLSKDGEGLFFEFLSYFEKDTGLDFNKLPYTTKEINGDYNFKGTANAPTKDDILIYSDNFVLIDKHNKPIFSVSELTLKKVGILSSDIERLTAYFKEVDGIFYQSFDSVSDLIEKLNYDELDYIVLPKITYSNIVLENDLKIIYQLEDIKYNYVLSLSSKQKTLNTIIKKKYRTWSNDNYEEILNKNVNLAYFNAYEISEKERASLKSKSYVYGYVDYLPFEGTLNRKLNGINIKLLKSFEDFASVDFTYKKYKDIDKLIEDFGANKIDMIYGHVENNNLADISYDENSVFLNEYVILANPSSNLVVNTLNSLKNKKVHVLKDTKLESFLKNSDIKPVTYNNISRMLSNINKSNIIMVDYEVYNYYKNSKLRNYEIVYRGKIKDSYGFIIKRSASNETFDKLFNYYMTFTSIKELKNATYEDIYKTREDITLGFSYTKMIYVLLSLLVLIFILTRILKIRGKKEKLAKDDKIKYIDILTSLKNRNYLNGHIEEWDKNIIYPQCIVIIDLNNVKYVNDNYGHEEGDELIKGAANILIKSQLENSDIIRTDGNEFLIYLVGYDEKQVVAYTRKLNKELKTLPHEFGASIGISMITDEIKTIDDAINEATLEMRSNKEILKQ